MVDYSSGVVLIVKRADFPGTTEDWYKAQNAQGSNGLILKLASGVTEFAVSGDDQGSKPNVTFVVNKLEVTLIGDGDGITLKDLEAAADSYLSRA